MIISLIILGNNNIYAKDKDKIKDITIFNTINQTNDELEDTKYCVRGEVQFIRKENLTVGIYGKTDLRHNSINNEMGINFVIGTGNVKAQKQRRIKG